MKVPVSVDVSLCWWVFKPQQAIVPSVFSPQVCDPPALTALYVPAATVPEVDPQQEIAPALLNAQEWLSPRFTAVKLLPDGASLTRLLLLFPQQASDPSVFTPQVWDAPPEERA